MNQTCPTCIHPADPSATICQTCTKTLRHALANIPRYWHDLTTVRARQTRYHATRQTSDDNPLPIDLRFGPHGYGSQTEYTVRTTLAHWTGQLLPDGRPAGPACRTCSHHTCLRTRLLTTATIEDCCQLLRRELPRLRKHPDAATAYRQLTNAETRLESICDRPADSWYAGQCGAIVTAVHDSDSCDCPCHQTPTPHDAAPCSCHTTWTPPRCDAELYPRRDEGAMDCPSCRARINIGTRRKALIDQAQDEALPAAGVARALSWLHLYDGKTDRLAARIRKWSQRGQLTAWNHDSRPSLDQPGTIIRTPQYRIRDVIELLAEDESRRVRHADRRKRKERSA